MTVFYIANGTIPRSLDYGFGTCQCLMFLLSSLLNPIVFFFHLRTRKKSTSLLLVLLALSDFVSILIGVPGSVYNFFRRERDRVAPPTLLMLALTIGQLFFYRLSLFITTMMSIQRLVCIIFPRYIIKPRLIYMVLLVWFINMVFSFVMYMVDLGMGILFWFMSAFH